MDAPRTIRLFIASPGDVRAERRRVEYLAKRISDGPGAAVKFEVIRWENLHYRAHLTFQHQIPKSASCDIVIAIFGNELGTPLPDTFEERLPDKVPYPSGTAYEVLTAIKAAEDEGRPDVYVFRKTKSGTFTLRDREAFGSALAEKDRLEAFLQTWFRTEDNGWRRSYREVDDTDEFGDHVNALLRDWVRDKGGRDPVARWPIETLGSPFRGLEPFDPSHGAIYFGRDRKVGNAIKKLTEAAAREDGYPFLLVVGPSGAGKSSLVRAGITPRLTAPGAVGDVDEWRIAIARPGAGIAAGTRRSAFDMLAEALVQGGDRATDPRGYGPALPELLKGQYPDVATLAAALRAGGPVAVAALRAGLGAAGAVKAKAEHFERALRLDLLLILDQFDELFATDVPSWEREAFGALLRTLAETRRVWVIATLRADLYPKMISDAVFLALKDRGGQYDLASPGESELTEILASSAEAAGLVYEQDPETGMRLDERMLKDATGADSLPLLQFALERLFERRETIQVEGASRVGLTFAAYRAIGELDGAIDGAGERAIAEVSKHLGEREIAVALPRLLRRLAAAVEENAGAAAATLSLTLRGALLDHAAPDAASKQLAKCLIDARILVSDGTDRTATLRVAHEKVLTSWARARDIALAQRNFFRVAADVERQRARWVKGDRAKDLLLETGAPVRDAQAILREFGDDLAPEARRFIGLSTARARWRRRAWRSAMVMICVIAVIATASAFLARTVGLRSARDFEAAKAAADRLVAALPLRMRHQKGIPVAALDGVLDVVDGLLNQMETALAADPGFAQRNIEAFAARLGGLFPGAGSSAVALAQLRVSRADMLLEFTRTYHESVSRSKRQVAMALKAATESLAIYQALWDGGRQTPDAAAKIASCHEEIADLMRADLDLTRQDDNAKAIPADDLAPVQDHLLAALKKIEYAKAHAPANAEARPLYQKDLANLYARLGDVALLRNRRDDARGYYEAEATQARRMQADAPDDKDALRELGWSYRKSGEFRAKTGESEQSLALFEQELCLRRWTAKANPADLQVIEDLAFGLSTVGNARMKVGNAEGAHAAYAEAWYWRGVAAEGDTSNFDYAARLESALKKLAQFHADQRDAQRAFDFTDAAKAQHARIVKAFPEQAGGQQARDAARTRDDVAPPPAGPPLKPGQSVEEERRWIEQRGFARMEAWDLGCIDALSLAKAPPRG